METKIFEDFELQEGKEKIMLSAPHAFIHMRGNEIRLAETNTDTIVKELADELKVYGIYKTISSDNDANFDKESDYRKEALKQIKRSKIGFLIDLHGMAFDRDCDICLCTSNYELVNGNTKFIDDIIKIFNKNGFAKVNVDDPFDASRKETVAHSIHTDANIMTLQIEINGKYRLPECAEYNLDGLKNSIKEIIKLYKNITK